MRSSNWQVWLVGGGVKQIETSIDSGGDFQIDNFFFRASASRNFGDAWNTGISLDYGEDRYKFSGYSGFGGMEFAGRLRLEDAQGNRLSDSDYDTAPFVGAFARTRFQPAPDCGGIMGLQRRSLRPQS